MDEKKVYYNKPQLKALLVDAPLDFAVWGRGTGKSSGFLAPKIKRNATMMPRGCGVMPAATYLQTLTRTLPSMINGLSYLGLIKDKHYVIGHRAPKNWKWEEPFEPPLNYRYFIHFCNGSGIHLVSQDIVGSSNGINSDYIIGDEAKLLDKQQFDEETMPTLRANRRRFGHLYYHRSIAFSTSMPTEVDGKWIFEMEALMDPDQVKLIMALQLEVNQLSAIANPNRKVLQTLKRYIKELNELRKGCVHYHEASTLENIAILGEDYILQQKRILPEFIFNTEILNIRPDAIEGGFYPAFDKDRHCYTNAYNNSYLEDFDYKLEDISIHSKIDSDCNPALPLWISADWGAHINCLTIGQKLPFENRVINAIHVKEPLILDDLAKEFCNYYRAHKNKDVFFAYDHTGNTSMANSPLTFADQFSKILRQNGWKVNKIGKKAAPTHNVKYLLVNRVLSEQDPQLRPVRFNKNNCKYLIISILQAPAKDGRKGIEKVKKSEQGTGPQEEATHYSDSFDILMGAWYSDALSQRPDFLPMLTA